MVTEFRNRFFAAKCHRRDFRGQDFHGRDFRGRDFVIQIERKLERKRKQKSKQGSLREGRFAPLRRRPPRLRFCFRFRFDLCFI